MKRLTYAPKVYAFIRRSRADGVVIHDVSDFIVSGEVSRVINQTSKAQLVLRNKSFRFSPRNNSTVGGSFFLPMDAITIWLQRIKGSPIHVFSGYLDSVPYYQMYPGNCLITASCTLKRLEHTYFDPGTSATRNFFEAHGWTSTAAFNTTGQDFSSNFAPATDPKTGVVTVSNGGYANILQSFLREICNWPANGIFISDLPTGLAKTAADMFKKVELESEIADNALEAAFADSFTTTILDKEHADTTNQTFDIVRTVVNGGGEHSIPPVFLVAAAITLSGLNPIYVGSELQAGLFAQRVTHRAAKQNPDHNNIYADVGNLYTNRVTLHQITDPRIATQIFARQVVALGRAEVKKLTTAVGKEDLATMANIIGKVSSTRADKILSVLGDSNTKGSWALAKQFISGIAGASRGLTGNASNPTPDLIPATLHWQVNTKQGGVLTTKEAGIYPPAGQHNRTPTIGDDYAPYVYVAHKYKLSAVTSPANDASTIAVRGTVDQMRKFFDWAKKQIGATKVQYGTTTVVNRGIREGETRIKVDEVWSFGRQLDAAANADNWPGGYIYITLTPNQIRPKWNGSTPTGVVPNDPANTAPKQDLTLSEVAAIGFRAAFYAQYNFPTATVESTLLTGDRALLNDISVMDGVTQFAGGALRSFMSLPGGEFCAFYPDYFGAHGRKAYHSINDIEITNMGIQLSDESLVTHMYVTGGTHVGDNIISPLDHIQTRGVVTLDQIFSSNNFITGNLAGLSGKKSSSALDREEGVYEFLKNYGARPKSIDNPIIHSPIYEFLYAWQMFMFNWAAQFQTKVDFTFQPEIMAGGRIRFPQHQLEMYVNDVTHSFDYENGFYTTATLMAPTATESGIYPDGFALTGGPGGFGTVGE